MQKLTPAPEFKSQVSKPCIDQLVQNNITDPKQAIWARIYFYRSRLSLTPKEVAQMLSIDVLLVNHITKHLGNYKTVSVQKIDTILNEWFPRDSLQLYNEHLKYIQHRIKKRIFA